jgi:hypothetical protein
MSNIGVIVYRRGRRICCGEITFSDGRIFDLEACRKVVPRGLNLGLKSKGNAYYCALKSEVTIYHTYTNTKR